MRVMAHAHVCGADGRRKLPVAEGLETHFSKRVVSIRQRWNRRWGDLKRGAFHAFFPLGGLPSFLAAKVAPTAPGRSAKVSHFVHGFVISPGYTWFQQMRTRTDVQGAPFGYR